MTTPWPDYELLDFGAGRKLERFGAWVLDRPCPAAADLAPSKRQAWSDSTARYDGERADDGQWTPKQWTPKPARWAAPECQIDVAELNISLQLAALPSGQVGMFPEQLENWTWIAKQVAKQVKRAKKPLQVLNLFAYTGGSTLAAARAGAQVTHVDAAKSMVTRGRANSTLSGLAKQPIRWIVEDALKFCQREVRRGNHYDAIILDPPSYGHGPKGEAWSIQRDLLPLLELCGQLTAEHRAFVLCSCHSPNLGPAELSAYLSDGIFGHCGQPPQSGQLYLQTAEARKLASGVYARWPA